MQNIEQRSAYVEREKGKFGTYDVLLPLVGMTSEPIIRNIMVLEPKKVIFFVTKESERILDEVCEQCSLKPSQFGRELCDISKSEEIYSVMKKTINEEPKKKYAIDITGGKKTMVAMAFLVGSYYNVDMFYSDFTGWDSELRRPAKGSEFLAKVVNPLQKWMDHYISNGLDAYNSKSFSSAAEIFKSISITNDIVLQKRKEILISLCEAYDSLYSFDLKRAYIKFFNVYINIKDPNIELNTNETLLEQQKELFKELNSFISDLEKEKGYLELLKDPHKAGLLLMLSYVIGEIKLERNDLNGAALHFYRTIELFLQHRLALLGFDSSNIDITVFTEEEKEEFRKISKTFSDMLGFEISEEIFNKSGLMQDIKVLKLRKDPIIELFDLKSLLTAIEARNMSFLIHGFQPPNDKNLKKLHSHAGGVIQHGLKEYNLSYDLTNFLPLKLTL